MNDMSNAHMFEAKANETLSARDRGNLFRGKFLDKCALVEKWAVGILTAEEQKSFYLFGKKIEALKAVSGADPPRLKNPEKVERLLERFAPYVSLRSHLAHSTVSVAAGEDRTWWIFEHAGGPPGPLSNVRRAFAEDDFRAIIKDVSEIAHNLTHQTKAG